MAVVKANAYGHGIIETAALYQKLGIIGWPLPSSGRIELRKPDLDSYLVFGGCAQDQIQEFLDWVGVHRVFIGKSWMDGKTAQPIGKRARVHLKIDIGMERIGAPEYETRDFLARAAKSDHLEIIGIYSHQMCRWSWITDDLWVTETIQFGHWIFSGTQSKPITTLPIPRDPPFSWNFSTWSVWNHSLWRCSWSQITQASWPETSSRLKARVVYSKTVSGSR